MTRGGAFGVLFLLGAGWGLSQPLTKIAVSTGYLPLGLIFWQLVIGACVLGIFRAAQGKPITLPRRNWGLFLLIALLGTILPNSFSYRAAAFLPSGVMSVVISLVPLFAFPVALAFRTDRFSTLRLVGLLSGLVGVTMLTGPESLPEPGMVLWLPVALVAPLCYAFEGNIVAKWGTQGLGAGHVLFGASIFGAVIALPLAVMSGQFINPLHAWGAPDYALVGASFIHAIVYTGYVWLVGVAGSVFAAQVAYVVTGTGVLWAMLLLSERYSGWVWAAMALILVGMALVQPRRKEVLAP